MAIVYGLNYLDKTTLSYASITGLRPDIHIDGAQYSWLGTATLGEVYHLYIGV